MVFVGGNCDFAGVKIRIFVKVCSSVAVKKA